MARADGFMHRKGKMSANSCATAISCAMGARCGAQTRQGQVLLSWEAWGADDPEISAACRRERGSNMVASCGD